MTRSRSSFLAIAACAGSLALVPSAGQAASGGAPYPDNGGGGGPSAAACNTVRYDGKTFILNRRMIRCRSARYWVRRLHETKGASKPPGWKCTSGTRFRTGGNCSKGSRYFGWHPGD